MKKPFFLSVLLIFSLILNSVTFADVATRVEQKMGDVNNDSVVDVKDALLIYKVAYGQDELEKNNALKADVDRDGTISSNDAKLILKKVVGTIDSFGAMPTPTATPTPTPTPSAPPTSTPTPTPTVEVTEEPIVEVTAEPTAEAEVTSKPTNKPVVLKPGVYYQAYNIPSSFKDLPEDNSDERMTFVADGFKSNFDIKNENPNGLSTHKYFEFTSQITIEASDEYTFYNESDDASEIYINDELINDNGGCHGVKEVQSKVYLEKGVYPIRVRWYSIHGGDHLKCSYSCSSFSKKVIPDEVLNVPVSLGSSVDCESFVFKAENNPALLKDIVCKINKVTGVIETPLLPDGYNRAKLVPTFLTAATSVTVDGKNQLSGITPQIFEEDVKYVFSNEDGEQKEYTVKFNQRVTGLPAISINTEGGKDITSKEEYLTADIGVSGGATSYSIALPKMQTNIRGRGNHSWGLAKKSYRLKFDSKTTLLGFNAQKSYVLQCNHVDPAIVRNYVCYDFARKLGKSLGYTTNTAFFDLYLNGKYMGNYMLMEKLTLGKNQLNLDDESTTDDIGCLLEVDFRNDQEGKLDVDYFKTDSGKMFAFKEPDELTAGQKAYIKDYVKTVEKKIMNGEDVSDLMDMDSFVDWFLVMTVVKNNDADMWASCYFHKDKGGKLKWGPVWDFDTCLGNCYWVASYDSWYPSGSGNWIDKLIKTDEFKTKFRKRWYEVRDTYIEEMYDCVDSTAALIEESFAENMKVWNVFDSFFWLTTDSLKNVKTFDGQMEYIKDWLTNRLAWIDANIDAFTQTSTKSVSSHGKVTLKAVSNAEQGTETDADENKEVIKEIYIDGSDVQAGVLEFNIALGATPFNEIALNDVLNQDENRCIFEYAIKDNILKIAFVSSAPIDSNECVLRFVTDEENKDSLTLVSVETFDNQGGEVDSNCQVSDAPTPTVKPSPTEQPNSTGQPSAPTNPDASELPEVTGTPIASKTPGDLETPSTSEMPGVTETPSVNATPSATETPSTSKAPSVPKIKVPKIKVKRLSKNKVRLTWKKAKGCQYKLFVSKKKLNGYKTGMKYKAGKKFVLKKLFKTRRCFVKIRARKKVGNVWKYSKYSKAKKVYFK